MLCYFVRIMSESSLSTQKYADFDAIFQYFETFSLGIQGSINKAKNGECIFRIACININHNHGVVAPQNKQIYKNSTTHNLKATS